MRSPRSADVKHVQIDPHGDVILVCLTESKHGSANGHREASEGSIAGQKFIRMQVSSAILMNASTVFKVILSDPIKRGVEIIFDEDDPVILKIMLDILHDRLAEVPMQVQLEMLVRFAILADKYCVQKSVVSVTDTWFENLQVFDEDDDEIDQEMFASYTLRSSTWFRKITMCAPHRLTGKLWQRSSRPDLLISDSFTGQLQYAITT